MNTDAEELKETLERDSTESAETPGGEGRVDASGGAAGGEAAGGEATGRRSLSSCVPWSVTPSIEASPSCIVAKSSISWR